MAFESLTDKLQNVFKKLRSKGTLTEDDVKTALREVKMALLEADVNYQVVKDLVAEISERSKGTEVMESLTPGQQVVKIVHESLIGILGQTNSKIMVSPTGFTVIMLYGLQGAVDGIRDQFLPDNVKQDIEGLQNVGDIFAILRRHGALD